MTSAKAARAVRQCGAVRGGWSDVHAVIMRSAYQRRGLARLQSLPRFPPSPDSGSLRISLFWRNFVHRASSVPFRFTPFWASLSAFSRFVIHQKVFAPPLEEAERRRPKKPERGREKKKDPTAQRPNKKCLLTSIAR